VLPGEKRYNRKKSLSAGSRKGGANVAQAIKNMAFWKKVVLTGAIPLLAISIAISALSYSYTRRTVSQSERNNLSAAVNRIDNSLTVRVRQINTTLQFIAGSLPLLDGGTDTEALRVLSRRLAEPFHEIRSVSVFRGEALLFREVPSGGGTPSGFRGARLEELYRLGALYPGKPVWGRLSPSLFQDPQGQEKPVIPVCWGAVGEDGVPALVLLELSPDSLGSTLLATQRILRYQRTFLLDGGSRMIYGDAPIRDGLLELVMEQYRQGRRMFSVDFSGRAYQCCTQYNAMAGWLTVSLIAEQDLFPGAKDLRAYIELLALGGVLLACAVLTVLSRLITVPLARLNNGMKRVQREDFQVRLPNGRADEIGELTDSFNFMVDRIRALVNRVYQEQLAQKNAELETLQAQINPHFLYNTLDSINWMLIDRGEMDVSAIIVALGKLMQYSMDTSVRLVPLREEYRNARDFLLIQKNRLEDQLDYSLEIEAELYEFPIPKLILQPLIENAIKHGIVRAARPGRVSVRAFRQKQRICVTVEDTGAGMDPEALENCRRRLEHCAEDQRSIGLRNVARRLQLHFDGQCRFSVESRPGEGTALCLLLPMAAEADRRDP